VPVRVFRGLETLEMKVRARHRVAMIGLLGWASRELMFEGSSLIEICFSGLAVD
jgi:hypothetical protein